MNLGANGILLLTFPALLKPPTSVPKFGGSVNAGMNGKQPPLSGCEEVIVQYAMERKYSLDSMTSLVKILS
jgi:hypothetical protein